MTRSPERPFPKNVEPLNPKLRTERSLQRFNLQLQGTNYSGNRLHVPRHVADLRKQLKGCRCSEGTQRVLASPRLKAWNRNVALRADVTTCPAGTPGAAPQHLCHDQHSRGPLFRLLQHSAAHGH